MAIKMSVAMQAGDRFVRCAQLRMAADRDEIRREYPGSALCAVKTRQGLLPALDICLVGEACGDHLIAGCPRWWPHPRRHAKHWGAAGVAFDGQACIGEQIAEAHTHRQIVAFSTMKVPVALLQLL